MEIRQKIHTMSEPKRYWMDDQNDADFPYEAVDGEWVKWEDYARLKAQVERLYRNGDLMLKFAAANMPYPAYATMAKDWLAAKEGKPSV